MWTELAMIAAKSIIAANTMAAPPVAGTHVNSGSQLYISAPVTPCFQMVIPSSTPGANPVQACVGLGNGIVFNAATMKIEVANVPPAVTTIQRDTFFPTVPTKTFKLSKTPRQGAPIEVYYNGVYQHDYQGKWDFTYDSVTNSITFLSVTPGTIYPSDPYVDILIIRYEVQ